MKSFLTEIIAIIKATAWFFLLRCKYFFKNFGKDFKQARIFAKEKRKYLLKLYSPYLRAFKGKWLIVWGCLFAFIITAAVLVLNATTNYYMISYNGQNLGYSRNENTFYATVESLKNQFADNAEVSSDLDLLSIAPVKTSNWFLSCLNRQEMRDAIVSVSVSIEDAYTVYIDGAAVVSVTSEKAITNALADYKVDRATLCDEIYSDYDSFEFELLCDYQVQRECVLSKNISFNNVYQAVYSALEENLKYKLTCTQTKNEEIPYITYYERNDNLVSGTSLIIRQGKVGVKAVESEVVVQNGVVTSNKIINETVIKSATTAKIQVGNNTTDAYSGSLVLLLPVEGYVSSAFGGRADPFTGEAAQHNGLDIAAKTGTSIIAAAQGKVIQASDKKNGYGNCVIIEHSSGFRTLYAHCSELLVSVGDYVSAGDVIARVGSTGRSTGPHLHFSVIIDGVYVDPTIYF